MLGRKIIDRTENLNEVILTIKVAILLFIMSFNTHGQNNISSLPIIRNFDRSEYKGGMQTWMISQASNDLIYFANDFGLIEFDGHSWNLYGELDYSIVRSIYPDEDGKIYVGYSNNFGYFTTDSIGNQKFNSLMEYLPPDRQQVDEIWRIHKLDDQIVFQSYTELLVLKNNKISIYKAPKEFYLSYLINNKLYVTDWGHGILEFKDGEFIKLKGTQNFPKYEIVSIIPFGKDFMFVTREKGLFLYKDNKVSQWNTPANNYIIENKGYCALRIDEKRIAFGTIQNGLFISDNNGEIKSILNKDAGLQNNAILSMDIDKSGNLWLGSNNGIDLIHVNSPITKLEHDDGIGAGYSAVIHNNILYLGTNQGLYFKNLNKNKINGEKEKFKPIKRLKGQVWNLTVIDDVLFCGHTKGTYLVNGEEVRKLGHDAGGWIYLRSEKYPNRVIGGNYTGLSLFEKINGKWQYIHKIKGFSESSRMMYFDKDENIWMSHGFKGVYHLAFNEKCDSIIAVRFYNSKKGFKKDYGINIAKIQNQIVFLSDDGAFKYNEMNDSIEPSKYFNDFFSNKKVNYAIEDKYGNIWYYYNHNMGAKLIKLDGKYTTVTRTFKQFTKKFIGGFQFVYPVSNENFFISYEDGFIQYSTAAVENLQKPFNSYLSKVKLLSSDSVVFKGHLFDNNKNNTPAIDFTNNSIHFFYSAVHYESPEKVEFSTYLEGYDKDWSNWDSRYDRSFTNLKEGDYNFKIKARNIHDIETKPLNYYFVILPPWYRTNTAYFIFSFVIIFIILSIIYLVRLRINFLKVRDEKLMKKKYQEREKEMQQEAIIAEKEIIRLRNEQLQDKLKLKNKELANSTMETIKKNKFLISLKKDMQKNNSEMTSETAKANNKRLIRKVDNEINNEKNWQVFETHFGNVHEEFLLKLKQQYPQISPAELRLCACLRMNISSKEIASLLNISLRGVEASRYRLRKALKLDRETNLTDFILSI